MIGGVNMSTIDSSPISVAASIGEPGRDDARRFEMVAEAANLGTWEHDLIENTMLWSPRARAIFGCPSEGVLSPDLFLERIYAEDRSRVQESIQAALDPSGAGRFMLEHRVLCPHGTLKWVVQWGQTVFSREETARVPLRILGIVMDDTDRKQTHAELEQLRATIDERLAERTAIVKQRAVDITCLELVRLERKHREQAKVLRAVLDSVGVAIVVASKDGEVIMSNPAAEIFWSHLAKPSSRENWASDYGLFLPDGVTPLSPDDVPLARGLRGESLTGVEIILRNHTCPSGVITSANVRPIRGAKGEINGAVLSFQDVTELKRAMAEIQKLSFTDQLTGLSNRRRLDDVLAAEVSRVERRDGPLSLVMADLDNFKRVNDELGHAVGDHVLKSFAALVQGEIRQCDIASRFGGEEFVVVLPLTDGLEAAGFAERLRFKWETTPVPPVTWPMTCSLGVAQFQPSETVESWLSRVDAALYRAKAAGRNRVAIAPC